MIATWMLYALALTTVLALGGVVIERLAEAGEWPRRHGWMVVAAIAVAMTAAVALRHRPRIPVPSGPIAGASSMELASVPAVTSGPRAGAPRPFVEWYALPDSLTDRFGRWDRHLLLAWLGSSLLLLLAYCAGMLVLHRRRGMWSAATLDGTDIWVSEREGPAVVGVLRPQVVLPRWALSLDTASRALLLRHETEHIAARDPLLWHATAIALLAMPWNLALWWVHRRLRLSIELDCDRRVLRAVTPGAEGETDRLARYGELLLTVATRRSRRALQAAPAFLDHPSSLSRRIATMCSQPIRRPALRGVLSALGAAAILAAAVLLPAPSLAAQQPGEPSIIRVVGAATSSPTPQVGREGMHALLTRYFPDVLRGEGPRAIAFLRDGTGRVIGTLPTATAERIIRAVQDAGEASAGTEGAEALSRAARPTGDRVEEATVSADYAPRSAGAKREGAATARVERPLVFSYEARGSEAPSAATPRERSAELSAAQQQLAAHLISADIISHAAGEVGPAPLRVFFLTLSSQR